MQPMVIFSRLPKNVVRGYTKSSERKKRRIRMPYSHKSYSEVLMKICRNDMQMNLKENQEQKILDDKATMQYILDSLITAFGVSEEEKGFIHATLRTPKMVNVRYCGYYLTRKFTALHLAEIGEFYGGRHHSTIINGLKNIENIFWRIEKDTASEYDKKIAQVISIISEKLST